MSVLNSGIGRIRPIVDMQQLIYPALISTDVRIGGDSLKFWNMRGGLLGSANGTTYGTKSQIVIQMAREAWASLYLGIYIETGFNQPIQMTLYQAFDFTTAPFDVVIDMRSTIMSVTIPASLSFFRFAISDALTADGAIIGGATVAYNAHYRLSPGLACPALGIEFVAAVAPTVGRFWGFDVGRSS